MRTPEDVATLLGQGDLPAPDGLPDLAPAVARLLLARQRGERVLVAGDYDADGLCATAVAVEALAALGVATAVHLPRRTDGFGLQPQVIVTRLADAAASMVLAVDNGSSAHAAIGALRQAGADVIVADHHQLDAVAPPALALINPLRVPDGPHRPLTGVGVTWYLMQALAAALGQPLPPGEDLVAVGTIADVGPLIGVNRHLVRRGLQLLAERRRPGLAALQDVLRLAPGQVPAPREISHGLAPRLNAPGRLGDPTPALELLLAPNATRAAAALAQVEEANSRRREAAVAVLTAATAAAASQGAGPVVLADPDWPAGLVGPAAATLSERLGVPVLLANRDPDGVCRGSGRAPEGWDLGAILQRCAHLLLRGGGHARAAGFELWAHDLERLRAELAAAVPEGAGPARQALDGVLAPEDLRLELALASERLGPFGAGFPEPRFLLRGAHLEDARRIGQDGHHLRGRLRPPGARGTCPCVGFGLGDWLEGLTLGGPWDLIVEPRVQRFRGQESLELVLIDAAPTSGDWGPALAGIRAGLPGQHPDRDGLAEAYRRLVQLARRGPLPPEAVLLAHLTPACLPGEEAARAALRILRELALFDGSQIARPEGGTKVDLAASPRFRLAAAAWRALVELEARVAADGERLRRDSDALDPDLRGF